MGIKDIPYAIGDKIKFVSRNTYSWLHIGDIIEVPKIEPGIFPGDVYVQVRDPTTKMRATAHYWRFAPV